MRGKRNRVLETTLKNRITPADAGKTGGGSNYWRRGKDHPRGCGENKFFMMKAQKITGSPPRMRGKPVKARKVKRGTRITPADAGKTITAAYAKILDKDHPRGCGENITL